MSKIVARMEKMKAGNLGGMQRHNQRETENHSNQQIDIERSHLNYDLVNAEAINYRERVKEIIDSQRVSQRAVRKDAVLVDEWIITSDKTFFNSADTDKFFEDSLAYFSDRCGAQNIAYATVHLDETTPHMHLGIVPMVDGRLSSKEVFKRKNLSEIQEELPSYLKSQGHDIERGLKGSERKHLTVEEYKENQKEIERMSEKVIDKYVELNEVESRIKTQESRVNVVAQQVWHDDWLETKQEFPGFKMRVPEELEKQECYEIDENTARTYKLNFRQVFGLFQEKFSQAKEYIASKWQELTLRERLVEKRENELEDKQNVLEAKIEGLEAKAGKMVDKLDIFSEELTKKEVLLQAQTEYLDRMAQVSELSMAMPEYVKPSRISKDMVIVPKEKWLAKHVSANAYHEMEGMRYMLFEGKRRIEKQTDQSLNSFEMRTENQRLKRKVDILSADNSAFRESFTTLIYDDKLDPNVAKTLDLPVDFKRELGLVERPSQRWTIDRGFDGPSLG